MDAGIRAYALYYVFFRPPGCVGHQGPDLIWGCMGDLRSYQRNAKGLAVALLSSAALLFSANPARTSSVSEVAGARLRENYGKLPLSFEENRGQTDAHVKFLSQGNGYTLLLSPGAVELNLARSQRDGHAALRMSFPGAQRSPLVTGDGRQAAISSYFVGNDPAKWVSGAPNYARVRYQKLYPGVDLVFYGNQRQLEYDLVVAPGADPGAIRMQFDGVDSMRLDSAGNLVLRTGAGELRQHRPIVYQERAGTRQSVNGRYVIQAHNRVAFEIAQYDTRKPLIIDPILTFATYLGSPSGNLQGLSAAAADATYPAVAVDSYGNAYLTGWNGGSAAEFPLNIGSVTLSAPQGGTGGGGTEVFVVKMNSTGTALAYSVVFGGGGTALGGGIAVDTLGNAYVTGYTTYTNPGPPIEDNFPITAGAPQSSIHGPINAFVTKVNAAGSALTYSTYLGGTGSDWGRGIAVDQSGNAYVTGTALEVAGTNFPLVNPISSTPAAGFLTEVNAAGTAFVYSTFLSAGVGYGITLDSAADAHVTGTTGTVNATGIVTGAAQAYVLKVNAGGSGIDYGPVLLGSSGLCISGSTCQSVGFGIALDSLDDAYVTGMTNDPNFPVTAGAAQTTYGGGLTDAFAVKLGPTGALPPIYGTYIGGIGTNQLPERGSGIGVDASGYAYVSGTTQCIGFPVTNPIAGALNGSPAVLMKSSLSGSTSTWSPTSLAGNFDQVTALAFDASGNIYAGATALDVTTGGGIYKSTDGGDTWTPSSSGITSTSIDAIAVDPNNLADVFAIAGGKIYVSGNSGTSWTALSQTVGAAGSLAISGTSSVVTIYAGSSTGLFYSTNYGTSWTSINVPVPVYSLVVDPNNAETAYAGTSGGVYKTTNGGVSWSAVNNAALTAIPVSSLAINSASTLYAATGSGLFYTSNGGTSWTLITELVLGIPSTPLLVAVDSGDNVYLAFDGSGMAVGVNGGTTAGDWSPLTYNGLSWNQILVLKAQPGVSGTAFAGIVSATDAFLTRISPDGGSFSSSTCIGGSNNNLGQNIAVTGAGTVYISGATVSTNFPVTAGAIETTLAGDYDAFVAGVSFGDQITSPLSGITLSDTLADFEWNAFSGATDYQLLVGTSPGASNIFNGTTTSTSQRVTFIPCTGETVYVQLSAEVNGIFQPTADSTYSCKPGIGDFNGDGFQDLLWQNNSTGQVTVDYLGGATPVAQGWNWLNSTGDPGWHVVGTGDFGGNGLQDLVWQNDTTRQVTVNYYGGAGGAVYQNWAYLNSAGVPGWSVVGVADMNGDGTPDLIWQNDTTKQVTVNYYGGAGGTVYQGWNWLNSAGVPGWSVVGVADFDQNGTPDLVWQNLSTNQVTVNYYGGAGGAVYQGWAYLNAAGVPGWTVVGAQDINGDGVPDLIWENNTTNQVTVNYYGGQGGATYEGWNWINSTGYTGWQVTGVADFNGNGEPDLVWMNQSTRQVTVNYYAFGGAVYQSSNILNNGVAGWHVVGTGDFAGTGVPALVWQNNSTRQVSVNYYGGAGGAVYEGWNWLNSAGVPGWSVVAVADMNGDGVPDLIWQNDTTKQVSVNYYGGAGGATYEGWNWLNSAGVPGWTVVGAADFDGNGTPDLVWQNISTTQVTVNYYGGVGGATYQGWAYLNATGAPGWTVVGASDFDGNGFPDLVWENMSTGQVTVNYFGGAGGAVYQGWNWLNSTGNPGSTVIVPRSR